jgi:hypothetical protein
MAGVVTLVMPSLLDRPWSSAVAIAMALDAVGAVVSST